jgi:transposase InsO family protein
LFSELLLRQVEAGSVSQVWRILVAHGINTRARRFAVTSTAKALAQAEAAGFGPDTGIKQVKPFVGELKADLPGDLVQMDCFHLGRLKGAKTSSGQATVWQYTAIDVASSFVWAETHTTRHAPSKIHTTALVHRVAQDLAKWGWKLQAVSTDSGNEFRNQLFTDTVASLGAVHRRIKAGRPQSNGKVEQVQNTILQECWIPTFVGYHNPAPTTASKDLAEHLNIYNHHRPHWGKWNQGKTPTDIIIPNTGNMP